MRATGEEKRRVAGSAGGEKPGASREQNGGTSELLPAPYRYLRKVTGVLFRVVAERVVAAEVDGPVTASK